MMRNRVGSHMGWLSPSLPLPQQLASLLGFLWGAEHNVLSLTSFPKTQVLRACSVPGTVPSTGRTRVKSQES